MYIHRNLWLDYDDALYAAAKWIAKNGDVANSLIDLLNMVVQIQDTEEE